MTSSPDVARAAAWREHPDQQQQAPPQQQRRRFPFDAREDERGYRRPRSGSGSLEDERDSLPEWCLEDAEEETGTFDSSGAFLSLKVGTRVRSTLTLTWTDSHLKAMSSDILTFCFRFVAVAHVNIKGVTSIFEYLGRSFICFVCTPNINFQTLPRISVHLRGGVFLKGTDKNASGPIWLEQAPRLFIQMRHRFSHWVLLCSVSIF